MAKHLFLPQLDIDANIAMPNRAGLWDRKEHSVLLGISDGITIAEAEKSRGISSVPDIWARPLMFQTALKPGAKSAHPLRERILQEWRGLLSLLALSRIKNYPIEIVPVAIMNDTFSNALRSLAPAPVQLEEDKKYLWTDILMIRYENIPLGAFSPSTLVYTGNDYREKLKSKGLVLKDDEGYLREPEHPEDLKAVGEWVSNLQRMLKTVMDGSENNPDQQNVETIHDLIKEWLKDIRKKLFLEENEEIDSDDVVVAQELFEPLTEKTRDVLDKYRVYHNLLCPLRKADAKARAFHSDMALALQLGRNRSQYQEVVVITANLLGKNIKIWENIRLRDLGGDVQKCLDRYFKEASGKMIDRENIGQHQAIWIRPEQFFLTDTLVKAKQGKFLTDREGNYNLGTKYVLPFRKEILQYFSPEQVQSVLKPRYKEEPEGVRFSFSLPIINGTEERVEKLYRQKDVEAGDATVAEMDVPVIEIFPNYLDKHWRRHYLFSNHAEQLMLYPVIDAAEPKITSRVQEIDAGDDRREKVAIVEISSDNAFPEGIEISRQPGGAPLGLVLVERPLEPREPDKSWKIGIDFGTSNTNVFRQSNTEERAEQWHFDLRKHIRRISAAPEQVRQETLAKAFVPDGEIDLPTPTTLRIFTLARKENLLLDYFIYFPTEYRSPHNVYSDIKWDTEQEKKTIYFIESLLFLLLVEIVSERISQIELACSYPKAFSETNIAVFKGDWERILKKMLDDSDCVVRRYHGTGDIHKLRCSGPFYETEGIASGEYFASEKTITNLDERAKKTIGAICLDVGGGTTDISIWFEDNIVADTSVLLAGRQISQLLQRNDQVRELLFSHQACLALYEKKNEPAFFAARMNVILKQEERQIQENLLTHANKSDIQWLRKMLAIEFCAIGFYTAMLTAATDRSIGGSLESGTGLLHRIATQDIKLHWGGNAAKFINWINFGKYDKDGIASKMLNAVFFNCLKDIKVAAKSLSQLQSPGHKSEVAGGLVVMSLRNGRRGAATDASAMTEYDMMDMDADAGAVGGVISGENIELSDRNITFLDSISSKELFDANSKTKFKSTSLDRLKRFVEIVNFFGIRFGLFTEDAQIKLTEQNQRLIRDEVLSNFIKAQSLEEGQRSIEPIFIMEMRILLEILRNELR